MFSGLASPTSMNASGSDASIASIDWWLTSEFVSGMIGVGVAGLISFGIQLYLIRLNRLRKEGETLERRRAIGQAILFKMLRIHSRLNQFHNHLAECYARGKELGDKAEPWEFVMPMATRLDNIHFTTDEMELLLSLKNFELFNNMFSMDEVHNSTVSHFATLFEIRRELTSQLSADMLADVATSSFTEEQKRYFRPKMVEVNSVVEGIWKYSEKYAKDSTQNLMRLRDELELSLGLGVRLEVDANT